MRLTALMAALLGAASGCSTTATIHRSNGPAVEGRIVGSDRGSLHVQGDYTTYRLDRANVGVVDHPGNIHLVIGTMLAVLAGAAGVVIGQEDRAAGAAVGAVYGIPAAVLLGWGSYSYLSSTRASACFFASAAGDVCPGERR